MKNIILSLTLLILIVPLCSAQQDQDEENAISPETFSGLKFRSIGPALMSGRISDIAINPKDKNQWFIAVGSGGIWKTDNAGTTFTPIFDSQKSYSIGCITIDPANPLTIWVGTGENSSGRHVGWGDGVYKSIDGGISWENVGLTESEHIAKILIHPDDSDTILVAAEGPLWKAGGDRGVYQSKDGGNNWDQILKINDDTGVCDLIMDPRNPDIMYAAAYQRRRHVAAFMGGGPESSIYKTTDGGKSWRKINRGLPKVDLGKIGLAISPQKPDVVYATVESARGYDWNKNPGGFFRSENGGETWNKMSDYFPSKWATGPHYYQELFADPNRFDCVYQMDAPLRKTVDGGKTWQNVNQRWKHGDNHAIAFFPSEEDHWLVGSDGGLYETFDNATSWRYFPNLPVTQFYKMAVDYDLPFYNVIGGTQDNNTQHGPSQTDNVSGIRDTDWIITVGGDGYACAIDPEDPDTIYSEWQAGGLVRFDRKTGERIDIQPQPEPGEDPLRWNWDAPIIISPHSHTRLYYASQFLYRSDDRGDTWQKISQDLSRGQERLKMEYMGTTWGPDSVFDQDAMSYFGNISTISESPIVEGLIYCGTDDGLIQVTEDGGENWFRVNKIANIPETAFVNDIKASLHEADIVYATFDNHKRGDFTPYIAKSIDRGKTWSLISGNLPQGYLVWELEEDHVNKDLLFIGSEYGIHFSLDGGEHWVQFKGGLPTIPFRDIEIQRRENDLVGASFGRGFYILDDYSLLRQINAESLKAETILFPVQDTLLYVPKTPFGRGAKATQGDSYYVGENPPFGAVFTYYLPESIESQKTRRQKNETQLRKDKKGLEYPRWQALREEDQELPPDILITVKKESGGTVIKLTGPSTKGFNRVAWDLRYPSLTPVSTKQDDGGWNGPPIGPMVLPGKYSVSIEIRIDGKLKSVASEQHFTVKPLYDESITMDRRSNTLMFQQATAELQRKALSCQKAISELEDKIEHVFLALDRTNDANSMVYEKTVELRKELFRVKAELLGDWTIIARSEPRVPSILDRINSIVMGHWGTTYGPTKTHEQSYQYAKLLFNEFLSQFKDILAEFEEIEQTLEDMGAPYTPGRKITGM